MLQAQRFVVIGVLLLGVLVGTLAGQTLKPQVAAAAQQEIALASPPLNNVVAQSTIATEAGIAAYFRASGTIDLNTANLRSKFRTIQVDNANAASGPRYLLGSVNVGYTADSEDPKVYVSSDGWVLAYYLSVDPTAKIIDIENYLTNNVFRGSKLETALRNIAQGASKTFTTATYYDFRFPNANRLMLVGERAADGDPSFRFRLPSSFTYYEYSVIGKTPYCNSYNRDRDREDIDMNTTQAVLRYENMNYYVALTGTSVPVTNDLNVMTMVDRQYDNYCADNQTNGAIGFAVTYRVP